MIIITTDSTFAEVAEAHTVAPSTDDLAEWGVLTLPDQTFTDGYTNLWQCGLFGFDLTEFFADCKIARKNCPFDDLYANYDGWAIGAKATLSKSPKLTGLIEGACVDYSSSCFGFYVGYSDSTKLYSFSPLSWE
jgi:hypothetical protein